jgi:hypothetical protein
MRIRSRTGPGVPKGSLIVLLAITMSLVPYLALGVQAAGTNIDSKYLGSAPGRFNSIKCGDVDEDGNMELAFANTEGYLSIIRYTGGAFVSDYHADQKADRLWGLTIGDVDQDGHNEIIVGGQAGKGGEGLLEVLDGKTHKVKWKAIGEVPGVDPTKEVNFVRDLHGMALGDPDMDGDTELVVGGGFKTDTPWGSVYIFNGKTDKLEAVIGPKDSRIRGVAIADIDEDGRQEIIFGTGVALGERPGEGYIRVFGYNNNTKGYEEKWQSPDMNGDVEGLTVTDIDNDGYLEIVATAGYRYREGYAYILRHVPEGTGGVGKPQAYKIVWQSDDIGPKPYGFDVADVDDDGVKEIITGNQPGYMWMFDGATHQVKWKSELLGTDVFGITHCDVNKDGQMEFIAAQGGYIGKADWTSGYSTPHIYVFDGRTRTLIATLGSIDYLETVLQVAAVVLVIITLVNLNWYIKKRKNAKAKAKGDSTGDYVDKVSRRRGVR